MDVLNFYGTVLLAGLIGAIGVRFGWSLGTKLIYILNSFVLNRLPSIFWLY